MPAAVALLVLVLIDRGRARDAIELLSDQGFDGPIDSLPANYQVTMALHARGAARLAVGELRAATADLLACGERLEELAVARRFGAPRALPIALRALAAVDPRGDGLPLLREAVALTADRPPCSSAARRARGFGESVARVGVAGPGTQQKRE
jgi:hypothetical protein